MDIMKRVLIKLSGGAFAGDQGFGIESDAVERLADEVLALHDAGIQVAVMVGGGNIFRGRLAEQWGIERVEADNIGMIATIVNSLILRGALSARGGVEVRVMTAIPVHSIAEEYIRLRAIKHLERGYIVIFAGGIGQPFVTTDYPSVQRAIEIRADGIIAAKQGTAGVFDADPNQHPDARQYRTLSYDDVLANDLRIMDQSAFILAKDHNLPIYVVDAAAPGAMVDVCRGRAIGTAISRDARTTYVTTDAEPR